MVIKKVNISFLKSISFVFIGLLCGCVGNQSYRRSDVLTKKHQSPPSVDPIDRQECGTLPAYQCVQTSNGKEAQHFYLAHIEFDDMGEMWSIGNLSHDQGKSQSQLATALATIDKAQEAARDAHREVVVIAYVHGWHNNSSPYDEKNKDLSSFKTVLQDLTARNSRDYPDRPPILVGIFLSWRGQAVSRDLITTYWDRRDAANRVGGASLTDAVTRLMFETKGVPVPVSLNEYENKCESLPSKPNSHFIIIGHSLGARALEHAIAQPMLTLILERQANTQSCIANWNQKYRNDPPLKGVSFIAPADLIVFLNAANDAFEMKAIIEALKRSDIRVLQHDAVDGASGPFLISITSDGDWATERVMPAAQWFTSIGLSFRKYDKEACDEDQLCEHSQSFYYRHSAASIREMRSHTVIDQDMTKRECEIANTTDDSDKAWPYFVANVGGTDRCFKIEENQTARKDKDGKIYPPWNDTPAFVISVPKSLIPSHTDIFQDGTEELLIAISNRFETFSNPTMMNTPAKSEGGSQPTSPMQSSKK